MRGIQLSTYIAFGIFACGLALGQQTPPGMTIIRPNGRPAEPLPTPRADVPNMPGFIIIRPQRFGSGLPYLPGTAEPENYGKVVIVYPRPDSAPIPSSPSNNNPAPISKPAFPTPLGLNQQPAQDPPLAPPNAQQGKLIRDSWDASFVKDMHVGFVHTSVREFERDGKTFLYGTKEQRITVARFGTRVELWEKESTLETTEGQVLVVRRSQGVGNQQVLAIVGTVEGNTLKIKGEGNAAGATDTVPFPEGVIGIAKEASLMKDKKPKMGGEAISYQYYAGQVNWVAKFTITPKAEETQTLYVGDTPRKLVKVEVAMEPIKDKQGGVVALPAATVWLDAVSFEPLKAEFENAPLGGTMVLLRTTKDAATRPPGKVPDLFTVQSIPLDKAVENIHNKAKVTFNVQLKGEADPATAFTQDSRQSYKLLDATAKSFTITATPVKTLTAAVEEKYEDAKGKAYLAECLGTSFYIDWDNPKTKTHAATAVARLPATASAFDKAKAVEAWVRANMNPATFENSMDTCSKVSQTMNGDCSEFSVLATGMCRSLGIPARTALGLVYAPDRAGKPYLAYHMWFEVYVENKWVALDGTLAMGGIGPGHLTITRATWHNERSMAPILPVMRLLMAKPQMQLGAVE